MLHAIAQGGTAVLDFSVANKAVCVQGRTMSQTLRVSVVIALYLLLNSSLNMLNKWALASFFPFPLLLTTVHMLFSFVVRLLTLDRLVLFKENGYLSLHWPHVSVCPD